MCLALPTRAAPTGAPRPLVNDTMTVSAHDAKSASAVAVAPAAFQSRAPSRCTGSPAARAQILRFGRLEIDADSRSVRLDGVQTCLTGYQFALLSALAQHAGRVLTRETLMDLLKGEPLEAFDRSIDVHVSRIRAAIEDDPKNPQRVLTVRGVGYLFTKRQDAGPDG